MSSKNKPDGPVSLVLKSALYRLTAAFSKRSMPLGFSSDSCVRAVISDSGMWIVSYGGKGK